MEDFNEGNGFYKVNLAYLNKEQVEDIENIIKRWNAQKYDEEAIRDCIGVILTDAPEQRFVDFNTSLKDCLTWLEKQIEHANFRNKIQIGDKVTRNRDGVIVNLSQLNRVAKVEEKQGEQKHTDEEMKTLLQTEYEKGRADALAEMHKPAWSEEDEEYINDLIGVFDCQQYQAHSDEEIVNWFKSLKYRVQPKQECSEEDENNILFLTSIIEECFKDKEEITLCGDTVCAHFTKEDVIERLKSLRPQWKPSDEQIEVLDMVLTNETMDDNIIRILRELREQLKKLRE